MQEKGVGKKDFKCKNVVIFALFILVEPYIRGLF